MKKLLTLTGAALVLSSSFTIAANQLNFNSLDSNADGVITKSEFDVKANKKADRKYNNQKSENIFPYDPDNDDGRNSDQ